MNDFDWSFDLPSVMRAADRTAKRICRWNCLSSDASDDIRQDLLLDLLKRLPAYDPGRGSLLAFAAVCFRNRGGRIGSQLRRDRARTISLETPLSEHEGVSLGEILSQAEGYSEWLGQPTDAIAVLERRLDLERAISAVAPGDHPLCAELCEHTPHEFAEQKKMPRTRIYRRIREMRLQLLAAGIPSAA